MGAWVSSEDVAAPMSREYHIGGERQAQCAAKRYRQWPVGCGESLPMCGLACEVVLSKVCNAAVKVNGMMSTDTKLVSVKK